ncbi:FtsX-like permease family protein [Rubripirellula tenax]|uniref:FtsX-like permease family protein n=1 Tax=Rubripirellula tenax TaxID=2528015 RepID=A0A5C6EFU6_9BACT|nr:FtsX-like permease family protein [Rubripirellula tenax]TWU46129.1 FtsX-like permease family protein [Rubripirellula tenax]
MNRLLLSDLKRMWRQGVAISTLLGCGIALFVMANSSMVSLEEARESYYSQYRFGDVFATLVRAPNGIADRVAEVDGVSRVQSRIVRSVLVDLPEMAEPASCLLVSINVEDPFPMNAIHLTQGRFPNDDQRCETVISELFAEAHGLQPGGELDCIIGGRKQRLRIVGIGLSPEYVYVVQPGLMVTDNRRYGVVWMPRRQMEAAFNMEGAFNSLSIAMQPHASIAAVIAQVDQLTRPYGGTGAYDRGDQVSHHRVADEMSQQRTMALVMPSIFLAVSAFLFNIVFTRLVNGQAEQIATLRAFGYRSREIGWHYVKMVLFWVILGSAMGCLGGLRLSWWMTSQYLRFFRFPTMEYEFATHHAILAIAIGAAAAILGTLASIRKAMSLQPAEAMRPAAPRDYRGLIAERTGFSKLLSPVGRMIVRRLETNRMATTLSVLGMSLAVAILVLGSFFQDTIDYVMDLQFKKTQRQDVMLTFAETLSAASIHDVAHLPGVTRVEPFRSVPVRMRNGNRTHRLSLMGMSENPSLYRILDDAQQQVTLPPIDGLTISDKLAEVMDVKAGELLTVEILDREQRTIRLPVARVFPNYTEPSAYMNRQSLHKVLREVEQLSGAFLSVDADSIASLYDEVKKTPSIAGVLDKHAAEASFNETISESTSLMRIVNAAFSLVIAFGVIYNCAVIILAERARDLATLRVMGFRRIEVSMVLFGELAIITVLSIPVGLPIGYAFAYLTTIALDTETHRFPLVIQRFTYAYAAIVVLGAASLSAIYVRRMLSSLDLVAVLKVKE